MKRDAWLQRVRDLSLRLAANDHLASLLPDILDAAIELTQAERGFLVLVDGEREDGSPKPRVVEARGFDQAALHSEQVKVSRTVIKRVLTDDRAVVTRSDSVDQDLMDASSVRDALVRSIACVPLRLRGVLSGALYLDHRFKDDAFEPDDLPLLEVFAGQAALALEWARVRTERGASSADGLPAVSSLTRYGRLVGASGAMLALYEEIERAARSDSPVLILGETGTGQELVARELHARGADPEAPFLRVSCALPAAEVAASLFGSGGALASESAGTVFLDDLQDLPADLQARLSESLRTGVTWNTPRLVAASHADLLARVAAGELREDLYYRLDVMRIVVPPLRQRAGDVPLLVRAFLEEAPRAPEVSDRALRLLEDYAWPGNVRELRNEVQRLCATGARRVSAKHLSEQVRAGGGVRAPCVDFAGMTLKQVEAEVVRAALDAAKGNKARAARQLGVPRSTLYHLIDRHDLGPA